MSPGRVQLVFFIFYASCAKAEVPDMKTSTVYGFVEFTTTIENTVMVFRPSSTKQGVDNTEIFTREKQERSYNPESPAINEKPRVEINLSEEINPTSVTVATISEKQSEPSLTFAQAVTEMNAITAITKAEDKNEPQIQNSGEKNSEESLEKSEVSESTQKVPDLTATVKIDSTTVKPTTKSKTGRPTKKPDKTKVTTKKVGLAGSKGTPPAAPVKKGVIISSRVEIREGGVSVATTLPKKGLKIEPTKASATSPSTTKVVEIIPSLDVSEEIGNLNDTALSKEEPAVISNNNFSPEYDFLSRQPSEVVDETYMVIDLKPNGKSQKSHKNLNRYNQAEDQPIGAITSMANSIVKDSVTTVYETDVIGTVISGKYAQVLQSTSRIISPPPVKKIKPTPPTTARILKTAAPSIRTTTSSTVSESNESSFETTATGGKSPSRRPAYVPKNQKYTPKQHKFKEDYKDYETTGPEEYADADYTFPSSNPTTNGQSTSKKPKGYKTTSRSNNNKYQNNRFSRPSTTPELATVSSEQATTSRRFQPSNRRASVKTEAASASPFNKRNIKTKITSDNSESSFPPTYKFKLNRPSGRWQYKTSPKPRVTIRRQDDVDTDNVTSSPKAQFTPDLEASNEDLAPQGVYPVLQQEDNSLVVEANNPTTVTAETLRVEISTPADFKDVYYEIATIKSPYSFQVGSVKNTRFITVTSTFEKSLVQPTEAPSTTTKPPAGEPLSENILTGAHNAYEKEPFLDSSIATLPPIGLASDVETPPLETMTESFSTTQLMLKTHILPIVRGTDTTKYTLVQSYHVTRMVTATKTLPPMEMYQTLNEFNTRLDEAGSEVHLELDFGDHNDQDEHPNLSKAVLSDLDLTRIGSDFDINDVDKYRILQQLKSKQKAAKAHTTSTTTDVPTTTTTATTPQLSQEQLQQLALLRLLNPNAALSNPTGNPVVKLETLYETHILPIFNGASTLFTTISRPTATVSKTEYVTNTLLPQPPTLNPIFQQPPFQLASSPVVTQTTITETESKVLKLTFGAKTSYTTLFSTKVTPTLLTTFITNSIPVQPTAAFPNYFNQPFVPFPFVG